MTSRHGYSDPDTNAVAELLLRPDFPWIEVLRGGGSQSVLVQVAVEFLVSRLALAHGSAEALLDEVIGSHGGSRVHPIYVPTSIAKLISMLRT
jgi:hypothetical protein